MVPWTLPTRLLVVVCSKKSPLSAKITTEEQISIEINCPSSSFFFLPSSFPSLISLLSPSSFPSPPPFLLLPPLQCTPCYCYWLSSAKLFIVELKFLINKFFLFSNFNSLLINRATLAFLGYLQKDILWMGIFRSESSSSLPRLVIIHLHFLLTMTSFGPFAILSSGYQPMIINIFIQRDLSRVSAPMAPRERKCRVTELSSSSLQISWGSFKESGWHYYLISFFENKRKIETIFTR